MDIIMFVLGFILGVVVFYLLYRQRIKSLTDQVNDVLHKLATLRHLNNVTWQIDNEDTIR